MNRYCYNCMFPVLETDTVCPHCGKPPEVESAKHLLAPGTLLHGRYLLGRALGQGGFGITYIGRDELLNMRVAVKEFYPNGYAYRDHAVSNAITITASGQDFFRDTDFLCLLAAEPAYGANGEGQQQKHRRKNLPDAGMFLSLLAFDFIHSRFPFRVI